MATAKILVVEDEKIVAKDIQSTLSGVGYEVPEVVSTAEEAIQASYRLEPDLVLMDVRIKGDLDGIDAADIIYTQFNIPVIFLTAYSDEDTLRRAKLTESYGFISKPYESKDLLISTEFALYKHNMVKKLNEQKIWFDALLKSLNEGLIATDKRGFICFINPKAESIIGYNENEIKGKNLKDLFIFSEDPQGVGAGTTNKIYLDGVKEIRCWSGDTKYVETKFSAARDDRGTLLGRTMLFSEIFNHPGL